MEPVIEGLTLILDPFNILLIFGGVVIGVIVPLEALVLLGWWFYQVRGADLAGWLDPLREANVGTLVAQWAVGLLALLLVNRWLASRTAEASSVDAVDTVP